MKIENKRSEITRLIDNIKMHSDILNELETIPVLELGVILSKINKLHEKATVLKYLSEVQQGKRVEYQSRDMIVTNITDDLKEEIQTTLPSNENNDLEEVMHSVREDDKNDAIDHMFESTQEEEEPIDDSIDQESSSDFFAQIEKIENPVENVDKFDGEDMLEENTPLNDALLDQILEEAKDQEKEVQQVESLVEKFEEDNEISSKPDVNEVFAVEDSSISGHLQKQPIADLMSAIGLNERYLYANDLFDGDMQEFKNAVKMLNEFENGEEAKSFFESGLRSTYNWEDDNTLAQALFSLLERRYL